MTNNSKEKHIKIWTSATYSIGVEGLLNESWSDRLAGMRITTRQRADQSTVTTLVGRLRDQAGQPLWPTPVNLESGSCEPRIFQPTE